MAQEHDWGRRVTPLPKRIVKALVTQAIETGPPRIAMPAAELPDRMRDDGDFTVLLGFAEGLKNRGPTEYQRWTLLIGHDIDGSVVGARLTADHRVVVHAGDARLCQQQAGALVARSATLHLHQIDPASRPPALSLDAPAIVRELTSQLGAEWGDWRAAVGRLMRARKRRVDADLFELFDGLPQYPDGHRPPVLQPRERARLAAAWQRDRVKARGRLDEGIVRVEVTFTDFLTADDGDMTADLAQAFLLRAMSYYARPACVDVVDTRSGVRRQALVPLSVRAR
jgi:hypothetical protein